MTGKVGPVKQDSASVWLGMGELLKEEGRERK